MEIDCNQLVPDHQDLALHADRMRRWTRQIDMAALEWILSMRKGLQLMKRYPEDIFDVKYEQLCSSPRSTLKEVLAFARLDCEDEKVYEYAEKVLVPAEEKRPFSLHPAIEDAFHESMRMVGYDA